MGDGRVMVGGKRRRVFAFASTGERDWVFDTIAAVASPMNIVAADLYAGSGDGELLAITAATGVPRWRFPVGVPVSAPVAADGVVYAGAANGSVYAVDAASGQLRWEYKTGGPVLGAPALANGVLYVGSDDLNLHAIDAATGTLKWTFNAGGAIRAAPAVVDGIVVVPTVTGELIGLKG